MSEDKYENIVDSIIRDNIHLAAQLAAAVDANGRPAVNTRVCISSGGMK